MMRATTSNKTGFWLTKLQGQLAALVKLLRSEGFTAEQVAGQLHDIRPEWERTLDCIRQLEA